MSLDQGHSPEEVFVESTGIHRVFTKDARLFLDDDELARSQEMLEYDGENAGYSIRDEFSVAEFIEVAFQDEEVHP